jgi:aspartyl-tRNA(Asn)/glutamyl-tRNA(Gln) amidotransferase subunit C
MADIRKVAKVARLELTEEETRRYSHDLDEVLKAFSVIDKVNTDKVNPTFQPVEVKNVLRKDVIESGLSQEEALSNARQKEENQFKGPKVV